MKQERKQDEYYLSNAEKRYLKRFQEMQNKATTTGTPHTMTVLFNENTISFFAGDPSGIDKQ